MVTELQWTRILLLLEIFRSNESSIVKLPNGRYIDMPWIPGVLSVSAAFFFLLFIAMLAVLGDGLEVIKEIKSPHLNTLSSCRRWHCMEMEKGLYGDGIMIFRCGATFRTELFWSTEVSDSKSRTPIKFLYI